MSKPTLDGIKQASFGALDKAKLMVGLKNADQIEEESQSDRSNSFVESAADLLCPELTFQQRLIGFGACFTLGYLITFMSFKFFVELIEGNAVPFALNYTFGNILALGASCFLCGPKRQFKNMFDEKRSMTSTTYLSCVVGTLVVVFIPMPWGLRLALLVCLLLTQCAASFWYSLSYIPYGRKTVIRLIKRYLGMYEQAVEGNVV